MDRNHGILFLWNAVHNALSHQEGAILTSPLAIVNFYHTNGTILERKFAARIERIFVAEKFAQTIFETLHSRL